MNGSEPKGKLIKGDINIILSFASNVETMLKKTGYDTLRRQAKTVQGIARTALHEARYEAQLRYVRHPFSEEEYPHSLCEDSEPDDDVQRFMRRMADEPDERF